MAFSEVITSNSFPPPKRDLPALLSAALPFLRNELHLVDPDLPNLIALLSSAGAGECWHKDGRFLDHLTGVHRILTLWGAPAAVAHCGLFHSVYSNSYVDLAIFSPAAPGRASLRALLGAATERLVHLFCVVPRHPLIHDDLLFRYPSDAELADHLARSEASLKKAEDFSSFDAGEPWRAKLRSVLPPEGVTVSHIRTGEPVRLSRRVVAAFLLMTMADFSDQLFSFQDALFENEDGRLDFTGDNARGALWPGDGRPGLWMNSVSRMGAIYTLISREEAIYVLESGSGEGRDEDIELAAPPVLDNCTAIIGTAEQREARDMYWEAVSSGAAVERVEELLVRSCEKNRHVGEPRLVLAQVHVSAGRYEEAAREAAEGLRVVAGWGSAWDKRMRWEAWMAWGRLLLAKAGERRWPNTAFGIINLGLVRSDSD